MNVFDYIKEYGDYTFKEKELNDIDAAIFSYMVYANIGILTTKKSIAIWELAKLIPPDYEKSKNIYFSEREGYQVIKAVGNSNRFRNCIVKDYQKIENKDIQYSVVTFNYLPQHSFVAFEGTNELVSGWKEDLTLCYQFPTSSHKLAINYLNKHFSFSNVSIIVGGHSKGGNLSLISSMYANPLVRHKIKKVYNFDGPGILKEKCNLKRFKRVQSKYYKLVPELSIIGQCLYDIKGIAIKTKVKDFMAHDVTNWQIEKDSFVQGKLSHFSMNLNNKMEKWLQECSDEEKEEFVNNLSDIMTKLEITSLLDLNGQLKQIKDLIDALKSLSEKNKELILDFFKILLTSFSEGKIQQFEEDIQDMIGL